MKTNINPKVIKSRVVSSLIRDLFAPKEEKAGSGKVNLVSIAQKLYKNKVPNETEKTKEQTED